MKFYNRIEELAQLEKIVKLAEKTAHLAVMTGRRRVGKTSLIEEFMARARLPTHYFFVSKKSETIILDEFQRILAEKIPLIAGAKFPDFDAFFKFLFDYLKQTPAVIVFDEFQNFGSINPAVYSIFQKYWDAGHRHIKGIFICIGSVFTLMKDIFEHSKEPLFGRASARIFLRPFSVNTICEILKAKKTPSMPQRLLDHFTLFGGVPKYYHLMDQYNLHHSPMTGILGDLIFSKDAPLLNEGKDLLIEEFGKNYATYFSILQVIAIGYTQMSEIAAQAGVPINSVGKYLDELLNYYQIIRRETPAGLGLARAKLSRYVINDQFLNFWFRYVFRNASLIEMSNFKPILRGAIKDLPSYQGFVFESIAREVLVDLNSRGLLPFEADNIGRYWTRTGQVEIDIVAASKKTNDAMFIECKLNPNAVSEKTLQILRDKSLLVEWNGKIKRRFFGIFTLTPLGADARKKLESENFRAFALSDIFT